MKQHHDQKMCDTLVNQAMRSMRTGRGSLANATSQFRKRRLEEPGEINGMSLSIRTWEAIQLGMNYPRASIVTKLMAARFDMFHTLHCIVSL